MQLLAQIGDMRMKKIKIGLLAVIAIAAVGFVSNLVLRYYLYDDYKECLSSYEVEEGAEFTPLNEKKSDVKGMELVAENDGYKLYTNLETTEIAIYDKVTKEITYSNPQDREEDAIANGVNKAELSSQIVIDYYNSARNSATINNYDMSIQHGQFVAESITNGIRYTYELKEPSSSTGMIPLKISEERLQTLVLDKLSDKEARTVKAKYKKSADGTYELTDGALKSKVGVSKLNKLFEKAGYTEEDYALDMGEQSEEEEKISFTIPIEYRLTDKGLNVSIPTGQIQEGGGAKIFRLQVLKFFGAAGQSEEGYMFVPNGSGSLIQFNNGKKDTAYSQHVYGIDPTAQSYVVTEEIEVARMPVFGVKRNDSAIFAIISNGDALANINADVSGKLNAYNYVYPEFNLREMELLDMFGISNTQSDTPVVEKNYYDVNLSVDYAFLPKEEASYSGMANYYREVLKEQGILKDKDTKEDIPLYLDIIGGVEMTKHILGVPHKEVYPMTTFDEAGKIVDTLSSEGINNLRMNYKGWFNGGIYHSVPDKLKVNKKLGGKQDMEALSSKIEEKGGKLFGDTIFQKVPYTSKRFDYRMEASKYYSGYVVSFGAVNPATARQTSTLEWYNELAYNVMSPKFLVRYVDKFTNKLEDVDITGIGLRDLGTYLSSDKKRTATINRQEAEEIVTDQFEKLASTNKSLLVNGGDLYALQYASDIINAPVSQSNYYIVDQEVPFYEMVIHGSIDYAASSINLSPITDETISKLKMIEYGVAPRFTFSYEDSSNIKYTSSADEYSIQYNIWLEDAISTYNEVNEALGKVNDSHIISHEILENGVRKVSYDNEVVIYVNYSDESLEADGIEVEAKSYAMKGGNM